MWRQPLLQQTKVNFILDAVFIFEVVFIFETVFIFHRSSSYHISVHPNQGISPSSLPPSWLSLNIYNLPWSNLSWVVRTSLTPPPLGHKYTHSQHWIINIINFLTISGCVRNHWLFTERTTMIIWSKSGNLSKSKIKFHIFWKFRQ